jgi:AcrR family transcriptional regulator
MSVAEVAGLSRRERRRQEIRERILQTAMSMFETNGYEATTVNDIAARADIAYGTFFYYFPTKLDLLRELSDRTLKELFANVEEVRKHPGGFAEHFVGVFDRAAERTEEMGPQARDLIGAMMNLAYPETSVSDDREMRRMFQSLIEDGRAAGDVRCDEEIETLVEVVVGTWYSIFLSWVHFEDYPLRERAMANARFLARTLTGPE